MATREELWQAFVAGFSMSRVGFNAEYPMSDKGDDLEEDERVKEGFEDYLRDLEDSYA